MMRFAIFLCVGGLALGCAYSHDKFYYKDGPLCAELKSAVLGTGEAEKFVSETKCVTLSYSTRDTGLSNNATNLGGKVAEGLARGAVEGLNPVP